MQNLFTNSEDGLNLSELQKEFKLFENILNRHQLNESLTTDESRQAQREPIPPPGKGGGIGLVSGFF
jgi:hypothetical protein